MTIPTLPDVGDLTDDLPQLPERLPHRLAQVADQDLPGPDLPMPPSSASGFARDIEQLFHLNRVHQDTIEALSKLHEQHSRRLKELAEPLQQIMQEAAQTLSIVQQQIAESDDKLVRAEDAVATLIDLHAEFRAMMARLEELHKPSQHHHGSSV